jgi:tetratricopeptide (TPR) repeat protein
MDWREVVAGATALRASGRYAEALAEADRAVGLAATEAAVHVERGLCLLGLGRSAAAEDAAREALRLDPYALGALHVAAVASRSAGRGERALAYGRHAVDLAPEETVALRAYGVGLDAAGRWAEAEQLWRTVLLRVPGDAQATVMLAEALDSQGRRDEARLFAEAADPDGTVERAYRGDLTALAIGGAVVAVGVLLGMRGSLEVAGTVLLVIGGAAYGLLRWNGTRRTPATPEARTAVAEVDRRRTRVLAGAGGALAVVTGLAWLLRSPHTMTAVVLGTLLLLGGAVGLGVSRARPGAP